MRGAFAYHKQDANFSYLPEQQRQAKSGLRWMRVFENWARFKMKWGLPVALPYENIANLPWTQLAATPFDNRLHYSAAADYTHYLL